MNRIKILIQSIFLQNSQNWKFWILTALIFKIGIFIFQLSQNKPNDIAGFFGNTSPDTESYLLPVENLISTGTYSPDYRMPGYAVFYLPLSLFFSKANACNAIILFQLVFSAVSVYCLALTARNCFKSDFLFQLVFYSFALSTYTSVFDNYILSESFCVSSLIFSIFFITEHFRTNKNHNLILAGAFLTWTVFLRPMYAPLFMIFLFPMAVYEFRKSDLRLKVFKGILIFLIPFGLVESAWIGRNYLVHKRIVILTTSLYSIDFEKSYVVELMNFVKAWGGDRTWWNPGSEMRWFGVNESSKQISQEVITEKIPPDIYTSRFNLDSLRLIRDYISVINQSNNNVEIDYFTGLVNKKLISYTQSLKTEKPFLYYIKAPLILFKRFFLHSGTYNLFNKSFQELTNPEKVVKIFYSFFYLTILFLGMIVLGVVLIQHYSNPFHLIICLVVLYSVILFPFILRQIEYRYFVPAYPFLLLLACHGVELMIKRVLLFSSYRNNRSSYQRVVK